MMPDKMVSYEQIDSLLIYLEGLRKKGLQCQDHGLSD